MTTEMRKEGKRVSVTRDSNVIIENRAKKEELPSAASKSVVEKTGIVGAVVKTDYEGDEEPRVLARSGKDLRIIRDEASSVKTENIKSLLTDQVLKTLAEALKEFLVKEL